MRRTSMAAVLAAAVSCSAAAQPPAMLELAAGIHRIEAEVAATGASRAKGLMHRRSLPPNRGMLFVFPSAARHCMWMRNTLIPLSVAFLDDQGVILNIEEMQPLTLGNHCAAGPARYALEMNASWFGAKGLSAGTRIQGIDKAPAPR